MEFSGNLKLADKKVSLPPSFCSSKKEPAGDRVKANVDIKGYVPLQYDFEFLPDIFEKTGQESEIYSSKIGILPFTPFKTCALLKYWLSSL